MPFAFLVVDCNNFFVSCERVFNPGIEGKPTIVLSNNDGCCVSRSAEAKALGIPMGVPLFKIKDLVAANKVHVFSSNFELYGDMSRRVMKILTMRFPKIEQYSVDEAFIPVSYASAEEFTEIAQQVRAEILQHVGIPVSIGIASSRTLAKAGNDLAKRWDIFGGVFSFVGLSPEQHTYYLEKIAVEDVWGVGRKSAVKLQEAGIYTALDLVKAPPLFIKKKLSILGLRTQQELLGTSCVIFSELKALRKGICCSRSFGERLTEKNEIWQALKSFVDSACSTLRSQHSIAQSLTVYIRTSHFLPEEKRYGASRTHLLSLPDSYTPTFIAAAHQLLDELYKPGFPYAKAGVFLTHISPENLLPQGLFSQIENAAILHNRKVSTTIDAIRKAHGKYSIQYGLLRKKHSWTGQSNRRSQRYSTRLNELLVAH